MRAIVFTDEAETRAYATQVDAAMGYPRDGVDVGGGIHVPLEMGRTMSHADLRVHPVLRQWAYPVDDPEVLRRVPAPEGRTPIDLPADWEQPLPAAVSP
jgi:hypothetical protein